MFKNVASQKLIVFAFDSTTNLPKTGDAANITAYVSKDYGTVTVLGDTSATEMDATNAKGMYLFDLTQAETNADTLLFSAKSATANIVVIGVPATVFTAPNRFSSAVIDAAGLIDANTVKLGPTGAGTAQTARDVGLALPAVAAGTANGLLISGTNTGTTTFGALTITNAFTVAGGLAFSAPSGTDVVSIVGAGTGHGLFIQSGTSNGACAVALLVTGGSNTGGSAVQLSIGGAATSAISAGGSVTVTGATTLAALSMTTLTASGAVAFQSTFAVTTSTSLAALSCTTLTASGAVAFQSTFAVTTSTSLAALSCTTLTASGAVAFQSTFAVTTSTSLAALSATTITASGTTSLAAVTTSGTVTFNAFTITNNFLVSGTTTYTGVVSASAGIVNTYPAGAYYPSNVIDSGTAQSVTSTSIVLRSAAAFADSELLGATVVIRSATAGAGQRRIIINYTGSTDTALVDAWTTTPTGTVVYDIIGTAQPSALNPVPADIRQVGGIPCNTLSNGGAGYLGVNVKFLNDTSIAGTGSRVADSFVTMFNIASPVFTVASVNQTGDSYPTVNTNLNATITSRMATYTQPTGFLAATFPSGTVANTTNITAGTIATVSGNVNGTVAGIAGTTQTLDALQTALNSAHGSGSWATATGFSTLTFADIWTGTLTESYAALHGAPTPAQALLTVLQNSLELSISGTTMTVKKVNGTTTAMTLTIDDATNPTSKTRAT